MTNEVTIIGGGIAGLSAGQKVRELGHKAVLFEKNDKIGGHTATDIIQGFYFDEGPHISFTKNQEVRKALDTAIKNEQYHHRASITNYWKGHWIQHPVQCNLHSIPVESRAELLVDYLQNMLARPKEPSVDLDYGSWLKYHFGPRISDEFPGAYTEKYWTLKASEMTTDWIDQRIYPANLAEVTKGAIYPQKGNFHYFTEFRYPKEGGFFSYVRPLADHLTVHTHSEVERIDLDQKKLTFKNGKIHHFENLISSLPLPEFIRMCVSAPQSVRDAANQLSCSSVVIVNIGVKGPINTQNAHWLYIYDSDIHSARVHFPHALSQSNAPANHTSIQAEIYFSRYRSLEIADIENKVVESMIKMGIIEDPNSIVFAQKKTIQYANVIFDHHRKAALSKVFEFLNQKQVFTCGRYGEWAYFWTDDSMLSGWKAAQKAIESRMR